MLAQAWGTRWFSFQGTQASQESLNSLLFLHAGHWANAFDLPTRLQIWLLQNFHSSGLPVRRCSWCNWSTSVLIDSLKQAKPQPVLPWGNTSCARFECPRMSPPYLTFGIIHMPLTFGLPTLTVPSQMSFCISWSLLHMWPFNSLIAWWSLLNSADMEHGEPQANVLLETSLTSHWRTLYNSWQWIPPTILIDETRHSSSHVILCEQEPQKGYCMLLQPLPITSVKAVYPSSRESACNCLSQWDRLMPMRSLLALLGSRSRSPPASRPKSVKSLIAWTTHWWRSMWMFPDMMLMQLQMVMISKRKRPIMMPKQLKMLKRSNNWDLSWMELIGRKQRRWWRSLSQATVRPLPRSGFSDLSNQVRNGNWLQTCPSSASPCTNAAHTCLEALSIPLAFLSESISRVSFTWFILILWTYTSPFSTLHMGCSLPEGGSAWLSAYGWILHYPKLCATFFNSLTWKPLCGACECLNKQSCSTLKRRNKSSGQVCEARDWCKFKTGGPTWGQYYTVLFCQRTTAFSKESYDWIVLLYVLVISCNWTTVKFTD